MKSTLKKGWNVVSLVITFIGAFIIIGLLYLVFSPVGASDDPGLYMYRDGNPGWISTEGFKQLVWATFYERCFEAENTGGTHLCERIQSGQLDEHIEAVANRLLRRYDIGLISREDLYRKVWQAAKP